METFDIKIRAIVKDDGKIIFQALAEKDKKTGQHLIWADNLYIEDALKELGREIKRVVYKEDLNSTKAELNPEDKTRAEKYVKESCHEIIKDILMKDYDVKDKLNETDGKQ